jgi:hypothetical protein
MRERVPSQPTPHRWATTPAVRAAGNADRPEGGRLQKGTQSAFDVYADRFVDFGEMKP